MTPATLRLIMPQAGAAADTFAAPLTAAMTRYGIDTPRRQAAFLANVAVESDQLRVIVEDLDYTAERLMQVWPEHFPTLTEAQAYAHRPQLLADLVYANRNGNGPPVSGDGWLFRGRGLVQLTGRANYQRCGLALQRPLLVSPEILEAPEYAADSAGWLWSDVGCNEFADADAFADCCHRVSGGYVLLSRREQFWIRARAWLGVKP